mmetsp:Transcript_11203/g.28731  ORF Transcript_11203/g.28731 Transcript_11203/m.28731 type:complete len:415 (+) Transcript_11203:471-1715(+)
MRRDLLQAVGAHEAHRGGGHAHGAAHHLQVQQLPHHLALLHLVVHQRDEVVVRDALLLVRQNLEAGEHGVQLLLHERVAQLREAAAQRVASAVLAKGEADAVRALKADRLRRHDLVRLAVLQHAILVDARLVREGVGAHDRLVRLHRHSAVVRHHAADGRDVHRVDARPQPAHLALPLEGDGHDDLLQRGVARALADAVDGALHLARAGHGAGEAVGGAQPEVVLAVRGYDGAVDAGRVGLDRGDEAAELVRQVPACGVGDVKCGGACLDDSAQDAVQKLGVAAPRVLRAELDVGAAEAAQVAHSRDGVLHHLVRRHLELELHVDFRGGDEGVHARLGGALHRVPCALQVRELGAGEAADDGHVAVGARLVAHLDRDLPHRLKVVGRRDGEARLDDVHAQARQAACYVQLLLDG